MSTITVNSFTLPNYRRPGTVAYLRIYAEDNFFTSDGVQIIGRGSNDADFYKEIVCSIASNIVNVPSFTIDSTRDSIDKPESARYVGVLLDSKRERVTTVFENYQVPISYGSDINWDELKLYNSAIANPSLDPNLVYTRDQIDYLLSELVLTSSGLTLGETSTSAYRGDRGATAYNHTLRTDNPHGVTASQIGLGLVNNTADIDKEVSSATQTALEAKVAGPGSSVDNELALFSGTTGKIIKRAALTGMLVLTAGVVSVVAGVTGALVGDTDTQNLSNKTLGAGISVTQSISYTAGVRQTFAPNATTPGINVGSFAGDPSAPSNGDLWYNSTSNALRARINGANVSLGSGGGGGDALTSGTLAQFAATTSAQLATVINDETGSGALVFGTTPTLATPVINVGSDATGDIYYRNSGGLFTRLPIGTTGQVLNVGGSGVPAWATSSGGGNAQTANPLSQFAATTSAQLAGVMSDETGTGALVFATTPTLVTPVLGIPTSGTLTNCTGLPISTGVSGLGTGIATFLATPSSANLAAAITNETGSGALVFATSPTLVTPVLGTPSSGTLTSCTGLPISTGVSGLGTGIATFLATPSSANLAAALTDETGSGANVFATTPTLVTPILGTPTSGTLTNCTGLPISTGVSGLGTGIGTFLATPSSANFASAITDEIGTGKLLFSDPVINTQSGTSYTLVAGDLGKIIEFTNASAVTVTVPTSLGAGFNCVIVQLGAGQVTLSPSSTTLRNKNGLKTSGQYAALSIFPTSTTDTFVVTGDTAA